MTKKIKLTIEAEEDLDMSGELFEEREPEIIKFTKKKLESASFYPQRAKVDLVVEGEPEKIRDLSGYLKVIGFKVKNKEEK